MSSAQAVFALQLVFLALQAGSLALWRREMRRQRYWRAMGEALWGIGAGVAGLVVFLAR